MKHISSLDGIRGLAVLMVVYFHFMERNGTGLFSVIASMCWAGVDIFLVLSGFLITSILFEQRGSGHFFRNFYTRRALRLFPLYYGILFSILLLSPLFHIHWHLAQLGLFFYNTNYVLPFNDSLGTLGPFNIFHTYTLALEEQFYLVWPWLVGGLALSRRRLLQICAAGILIAPMIRFGLLAWHAPAWLIAGSLPTRMDALLMGAALSLMPMPSLRTARIVFCFALLPLPLLAWQARSLFFLTRPMQGIGYTFVAFTCAAVLVLSLYPTTIVHAIANTRVLRFFGKYSYGIYLWHHLFVSEFLSFRHYVADHIPYVIPAALLSFSAGLLVSTLIAMASYRLIEVRFLRLKRRFER
jgi:peptidoglycan/LPS O-acetylase OafA/YrhL